MNNLQPRHYALPWGNLTGLMPPQSVIDAMKADATDYAFGFGFPYPGGAMLVGWSLQWPFMPFVKFYKG